MVPESNILEDIIEYIKTNCGIEVDSAKPINLGYANLKWKVETDCGPLFIKQYNKNRYPETLLKSVETALGLQEMLYNKGIPCPKIHSINGTYIQRTQAGERFIITSFSPGTMVAPGEVNSEQMFDLGRVTGRMHDHLNSHAPTLRELHWRPEDKNTMINKWSYNWDEALAAQSSKYLSALEVQRRIIEEFDLQVFDECEVGWVHWDLFVDNILFEDHHVSAILDFDRMHFIYPEFDISRAILSGSIAHGEININSVRAFVEGYRESSSLSVSKLIRSIKLTWWKESSWLNIRSEQSRTLSRFVEESIWVGENWSRLEEIFNDL